MVEFISYDGRYPNLCSGILVLRIDGVEHKLPRYCMVSNGSAYIDEQYNAHVLTGRWSVNLPDDLKRYQTEIEDCVNINVQHPCCGGCI